VTDSDGEVFLDGLTAPSLYIVSRPVLDEQAIAAFTDAESTTWVREATAAPADLLIELAGRVCYLSFGERQAPKDTAGYIAHLIDQGHESVLEHAAWTFILTGVSRAFTHQLVRHRIGFSFSQLSQQYHVAEQQRFVEPSAIGRNPSVSSAWRRSVLDAHAEYQALLAQIDTEQKDEREARRALRSAARSVLPAATETKIAFSANARALRHFLTVRGAIEGDEEMRVVSALLLTELLVEAPATFSDFVVDELKDGSPIVRRRDLSG
jgi:thymidylate synthase (FAD)